jgi:hypothetical protein
MTTSIAELTVDTTAEFVGIVRSSIGRSVGAVTYPARSDRFGTVEGGPELPHDGIVQL